MPEIFTITGMPQAAPNGERKVIRFTLTTLDGTVIDCEAPYGVAAQVSSGLGTALRILRMALAAEGAVAAVAAEPVQQVHVEKILLADQVVVQLTNNFGVPYIFQIPCQNALEFADRLRTEATRAISTGSA